MSVIGWVNTRAIMPLERSGKLKVSSLLIGMEKIKLSRSDLPASGIMPQPIKMPPVP
jgi:hypothetical protein